MTDSIIQSTEISAQNMRLKYNYPTDKFGKERTFTVDEMQQCLDNARMNGAEGSEKMVEGQNGFSITVPNNCAFQAVPPPRFVYKIGKTEQLGQWFSANQGTIGRWAFILCYTLLMVFIGYLSLRY